MRKEERSDPAGDSSSTFASYPSLWRQPVEHGLFVDWDDAEKLLFHTYYNELRIAPEEHTVLVADTPFAPAASRERLVQLLFETFNAPAVYVVSKPVLAMYASGRTTGISVHIGDSGVCVAPLYEGCALPHAVLSSRVGGRDVTDFLTRILTERGYSFTTGERSEIRTPSPLTLPITAERPPFKRPSEGRASEFLARQRPSAMSCATSRRRCATSRSTSTTRCESPPRRESVGIQTPSRPARSRGTAPRTRSRKAGRSNPSCNRTSALEKEYELPDGQTIRLGNERFRCAESLFAPTFLGAADLGLAEVIEARFEPPTLPRLPLLG